MIAGSKIKRTIGEKVIEHMRDEFGNIIAENQPVIILREATRKEYLDYWKEHKDFVDWNREYSYYYEILTD